MIIQTLTPVPFPRLVWVRSIIRWSAKDIPPRCTVTMNQSASLTRLNHADFHIRRHDFEKHESSLACSKLRHIYRANDDERATDAKGHRTSSSGNERNRRTASGEMSPNESETIISARFRRSRAKHPISLMTMATDLSLKPVIFCASIHLFRALFYRFVNDQTDNDRIKSASALLSPKPVFNSARCRPSPSELTTHTDRAVKVKQAYLPNYIQWPTKIKRTMSSVSKT